MARVIGRVFGVISLWLGMLLAGATAASAAPSDPIPTPDLKPDTGWLKSSGIMDFANELLNKFSGAAIWVIVIASIISLIVGVFLLFGKNSKNAGGYIVKAIVGFVLAGGGLVVIIGMLLSLAS